MLCLYDYTELLIKLNSDINQGYIVLGEDLQILRGEAVNGYNPIIKYYYPENKMQDFFCKISENTSDMHTLERLKEEYSHHKPFLENQPVNIVLEEMKFYNAI